MIMEAPIVMDKAETRLRLGFPQDAYLVASFGMLGPTKQNHRLLSAWFQSKLHADPKAYLVFVGENDQGGYGQDLVKEIGLVSERVRITGWADDAVYQQYLAAADVAVQLRTLSRGETSAAVWDCLNRGIPTIVNAHGSMRDLKEDIVLKLPDEFTDEALAGALEELHESREELEALGQRAAEWTALHHRPQQVAQQYWDAIEAFYARGRAVLPRLMAKLCDPSVGLHVAEDRMVVASSLDFNFPEPPSRPRVFLDFSPLMGSKKVPDSLVRILQVLTAEWTEELDQAFILEPVYQNISGVYHRATNKAFQMLGCPNPGVLEEAVLPRSGDVVLVFEQKSSRESAPHLTLKTSDAGAQILKIAEAEWGVGSERKRRALIETLKTRVLEILFK